MTWPRESGKLVHVKEQMNKKNKIKEYDKIQTLYIGNNNKQYIYNKE